MSEGSLYSRVSTPEFRENYEKIFEIECPECHESYKKDSLNGQTISKI